MGSEKKERIHFIAIGGSIMHGLAIALKNKGFEVSGSDDEIFEPSRSLLAKHNLLPKKNGWDKSNITIDLDAVILGMHAKTGNPELDKARSLKIPIYSFPEYIRKQCDDKQRIVIAGSHGKTTITSMIMHVLKHAQRNFDFVVGAPLEGFPNMVKLTDAPIVIIEGDEYFSSALDKTPKFLKYEHHIGLISGIAWDHINAFKTIDDYVKQFEIFANNTPKAGSLIFCDEDDLAMVISGNERNDVTQYYYSAHPYKIENGQTHLITDDGPMKMKIFGKHNMLNLSGAKMVLQKIGITQKMFYDAITSFEGAAKRLQLIKESNNSAVFLDFAHAPSKVEATTAALKEKNMDRKLTACLELHTYSSLNKQFIANYSDTLIAADEACIYFNPDNNKLDEENKLKPEDLQVAFNLKHLKVFTAISDMEKYLVDADWQNHNLLFMSSGNFKGLDIQKLADRIIP